MIKSLAVRKDIVSYIKKATPNVFHRRALPGTKYPYVVFSIRDIESHVKELEIDVWDNSSETLEIEELSEEIINTLNNEKLTNSNHTISFFYNDDAHYIDDEDKTILRINFTFQLIYYGKE